MTLLLEPVTVHASGKPPPREFEADAPAVPDAEDDDAEDEAEA